MDTEHGNPADAVRGDLSQNDQGYRDMVALNTMPDRVTCPDCGGMATFQDDHLAARYECQQCGHAVAAMYADAAVAGTGALR